MTAGVAELVGLFEARRVECSPPGRIIPSANTYPDHDIGPAIACAVLSITLPFDKSES